MPDMPMTPMLARELSGDATVAAAAQRETVKTSADNPMQPEILARAPRCGARARTRGGAPCRSPAVRGRARCRMHGGKGSGAPRGNRNGWKHGAFSAGMKDIAFYLRMTAMVVRHANRTIWLERCSRFSSAVSLPVPAPRAHPMAIVLGEQPHAPGNASEKVRAIGAVGTHRRRIATAENGVFRRAAWPRRRRPPIAVSGVRPKSHAPPLIHNKKPQCAVRQSP